MPVTFTQDDLDALVSALKTGASKVQIGDRVVEYRSQKDLIAAIKMVQSYIDGVSTTADGSPDIIRPTYSKGES